MEEEGVEGEVREGEDVQRKYEEGGTERELRKRYGEKSEMTPH